MQAAKQLNVQPVTAERFEDLAALFHTGLARSAGTWSHDRQPRRTQPAGSAGAPKASPERTAVARRFKPCSPKPTCQGCWPTVTAIRSVGCRSAREATTHASSSRGPCHRWTRWRCGPSPVCMCIQPSAARAWRSRCCERRCSMRVSTAPRPWRAIRVTRPRAPISTEEAFYGTVAMFTRAGFEIARPPLPGLPTAWTPRYTMRAPCPPPGS
jgi:hypothetical protein